MDDIWSWLNNLLLSDGIVLTLVLVPLLVIFEFTHPAVKSPASHYIFGVKYWLANTIVLAFLMPVLATTVARAVQYIGFGFIDLTNLGFPGLGGALLAILIATFVADFFFYWFHRTLHANEYLWQTHLLHHSDEHMNALTAHRSHFSELLLSPLFIAIPTAVLFDLPPVTIGLVSLLPQAYLFFAHANIRLNFGPLWWLIISPDYHRIHHSIEPRHRDKNFTNWFPIWDILFNTAYLPAPDEWPETGVEGIKIRTLREAYLLPFSGWWTMFETRKAKQTDAPD